MVTETHHNSAWNIFTCPVYSSRPKHLSKSSWMLCLPPLPAREVLLHPHLGTVPILHP